MRQVVLQLEDTKAEAELKVAEAELHSAADQGRR